MPVKFLHRLKFRVKQYAGTEEVIVRLEVDDKNSYEELTLYVFIRDKYYPFLVNQIDLDQPDKTIDFIMKRLYDERIN